MVFVLDESPRFVFKPVVSEDKEVKIALVTGVAFPKQYSKAILAYLNLYHKNGDLFEKGREIQDEDKIIKFIDVLKKGGAFSIFSAGDKQLITKADAEKYKKKEIERYKQYACLSHPVYHSLGSKERAALILKISDALDRAQELHIQDFYQMLMIFETIFQLINRFVEMINILVENTTYLDYVELDGIEIYIDTQAHKVKQLIDDGLLYYIMMVFSHSRNFKFTQRAKNYFRQFLHIDNNIRYLSIEKLIKRIDIVGDDENNLLYVADYVASFTQRALRGDFSRSIADKLGELSSGVKMPIYHFHPIEEKLFRNIPLKSEYTFKKLVQD